MTAKGDLDAVFGSWTCHVCGDERPDSLIGVHKHHHGAGLCECHPDDRFEWQENVRYCRDRPACAEGATTFHHVKPAKNVVQSQATTAAGREYPCPDCDRVYPTPAGLGGHRSQAHRRQGADT
jgi:hypothetical protein